MLTFFGIYATGVMKWHALEMLMIGIILTVLAVIGGFMARAFDALLGPRRSRAVGDTDVPGRHRRRCWAWPQTASCSSGAGTPPRMRRLWNGPFFRTLPDLIFILIGFSNAVFITAHYASSRTLLTRLTPPEQTGAFFGAYAVSGTATVWLAPFLVNVGTRIFHSQQGGFAMIAILLTVGFIGLLFVRNGNRGFAPREDPI